MRVSNEACLVDDKTQLQYGSRVGERRDACTRMLSIGGPWKRTKKRRKIRRIAKKQYVIAEEK